MKTTKMRTVVAAAGIASVTAVALSSMGAGAAVARPLPGGFTTQTLVDGTKVSVQLKNESVGVQRATVALPTSRNVSVSGQVIVTIGGKAVGADIAAGYIVGCQLSFSATGGADGGFTGTFVPGTPAVPAVPGPAAPAVPDSVTTGLDDDFTNGPTASFAIAPGQATYVPIIQNKDADGNDVNSFAITGKRGGIAYSQERFAIDKCAGFAQARAKVVVSVSTDAVDGVVTLYGKPFSLG